MTKSLYAEINTCITKQTSPQTQKIVLRTFGENANKNSRRTIISKITEIQVKE